MHQLVAVLGQGVIPPHQPVATADDAGLVRGDGCFDATLLRDGHLFDLDEHLARLVRSCALLDLPTPDTDAWRALIADALAAWDGSEAGLKLVVTRGDEHGDGTPTSFLTLTAVTDAMRAQREGISVFTLNRGYASYAFLGAPWLLGGAKTLSYAINAAVKRQAAKLGADDVVFTSSDGFVLEAPTAAIVWRQGEKLYSTPHGPTGILESVSQAKVFARAYEVGWQADYALGAPTDIEESDGAWLLSSVRGTAPILIFDDVPLRHDPEATDIVRRLNGF